MKTYLSFLLLAALIAYSSCETQALFRDVVIQNVDRQASAQSQLFRIDTTLDVKNERDTPLTEVYFAIPSENVENLRLLVITDNYDTEKSYQYKIIENLGIKNDHNATLYKIDLEQPLKPGQTKTYKLHETYWNRMPCLPNKVNVFDDQKVVLTDSVYYFSPYVVLSQSTLYKLTAVPISYSDDEGKPRGAGLEYKFNSIVEAFTRRNNKIHFENNTPFIVFKEVTKVIEVSHWGNINVQEFYQLANEGAEFVGEFSRVDYSSGNRNTGKSALRGLQAKYPVHAWGMHYRDEVGNISTSRAVRESGNVNIQLFPRFPIFGGWAHNWVISYNLPTNHYLYARDDNPNSFVLKQNFGFPFESILAEKYVVKVILPEGATNIHTELPYLVDNQHQEKTFSYLDYQGRPTIVLEKDNVLDYHNKQLTVTYTFDVANIFIEPALLFAIFFALFILLIIGGRLNLNFRRSKAKTA